MHDFEQTYPTVGPLPARLPGTRLDAATVRSAYARWAGVYDAVFGGVSAPGRSRAIAAANALPGNAVLEVGVGTGLALPHYAADKRITGIDLSPHMLAQAQARVERQGLTQVERLLEMDAESTSFADDSFDIAVAMFVASVVPDARLLLAELKRVVRPGGHLLFVNHFEGAGGARRATERALAALSRAIGWHPDFALSDLLSVRDRDRALITSAPPFGLFTLIQLTNEPA